MSIVRGETASRTVQRKVSRMHDLVEGFYTAHAAELTAARGGTVVVELSPYLRVYRVGARRLRGCPATEDA